MITMIMVMVKMITYNTKHTRTTRTLLHTLTHTHTHNTHTMLSCMFVNPCSFFAMTAKEKKSGRTLETHEQCLKVTFTMCIKWVPAHRYLDQTRHSVPSGRRGTSCCELDGFILLFHKLQKAEKNFVDHEIEGYKDANGGFLKWWYPTTIGFPTKNDHFRVFWGYHHLRKHPNEQSLTEAYSLLGRPSPPFRHARKSWLGKG